MVNDPKTIFEVIRFVLGLIFFSVGLFMFVTLGEEPSPFFWATGGFLIGAQFALDWAKNLTKRK